MPGRRTLPATSTTMRPLGAPSGGPPPTVPASPGSPGSPGAPATGPPATPDGDPGSDGPAGAETDGDRASGTRSVAGVATGGSGTPDRSARASHQAVTPSATSKNAARTARWPRPTRHRPRRPGGIRSSSQPASRPPGPRERWACRPCAGCSPERGGGESAGDSSRAAGSVTSSRRRNGWAGSAACAPCARPAPERCSAGCADSAGSAAGSAARAPAEGLAACAPEATRGRPASARSSASSELSCSRRRRATSET